MVFSTLDPTSNEGATWARERFLAFRKQKTKRAVHFSTGHIAYRTKSTAGLYTLARQEDLLGKMKRNPDYLASLPFLREFVLALQPPEVLVVEQLNVIISELEDEDYA